MATKRQLKAMADAAGENLRPIRQAGLAGLLQGGRGTALENARQLPRARVQPNPWQPRRHADAERLRELADDIAARGILEPLLVRPLGDGQYQVIAGERRYQAAGVAGLETLPCLILEDLTDGEARTIALVENIQREDLDIEDEARYLQELHDGGMSLRDIGAAIHKSRMYVQRRLQLLADPNALLAYRAGELSLGERGTDLDEVPMTDLAAAAQVAADDLLQGGEFVTERDSSEAAQAPLVGAVTAPAPKTSLIDPERARWHAVTYKPVHTAVLSVRKVKPAAVPPEERRRLRRVLGDAIDEFTTLAHALDALEDADGG